jgi:hypothetical protein
MVDLDESGNPERECLRIAESVSQAVKEVIGVKVPAATGQWRAGDMIVHELRAGDRLGLSGSHGARKR